MFLENDYVIPLYDTKTGGPPRAFECRQCGKISKTEAGMLTHLRRCHNHEVQPCLFSMGNSESPAKENPPLKVLRAHDLRRNKLDSLGKKEPRATLENPAANENLSENSSSPIVAENSNSATATNTETIPDSDTTITGTN
jgi:hypothetical protein